jgi:hypothetical protein
MVIDDDDIKGITAGEAEADAPLVVNANAPLAFSITPQCFKPVPRGNAKVFWSAGAIEHLQFALGNSGNSPATTRRPAFEHRLSVAATERLDHAESI